MQNMPQPAAAPDAFTRALAELQSVLAELQADGGEQPNALAAMQPQQAPQSANALAPMTRGASGYPSQAWGE